MRSSRPCEAPARPRRADRRRPRSEADQADRSFGHLDRERAGDRTAGNLVTPRRGEHEATSSRSAMANRDSRATHRSSSIRASRREKIASEGAPAHPRRTSMRQAVAAERFARSSRRRPHRRLAGHSPGRPRSRRCCRLPRPRSRALYGAQGRSKRFEDPERRGTRDRYPRRPDAGDHGPR